MARSDKQIVTKWLDAIPPTTGFSFGARMTIECRTATVLHFVPLAVNFAQENVEYVHQMRVATRRACAAIDALKLALPLKRAKRCTKLLKKVRRSSGSARDLDVMIDRLKCQPAELNAIQTDRVLRGLEQRRKDVQPQMQAALDQIDQQSLKRQFARLADKVRWRGAGKEPDWKSAMTQILGRVASSFRDSGKPLEGATDLHDRIGELHRLRIWGKQLRYTMEIAVGAFGKPLRELYDVVEQTQTFLGVINDHAVARNFYQTWYEQESDRALANSLRALAALEQIGLEQSLCKFPAWWNSPSVGEFWLRWEERIGAFPTALGADNEDGAVPDEAQIKKKGA